MVFEEAQDWKALKGERSYKEHDRDLPPSMYFSQLLEVELERDSFTPPQEKGFLTLKK